MAAVTAPRPALPLPAFPAPPPAPQLPRGSTLQPDARLQVLTEARPRVLRWQAGNLCPGGGVFSDHQARTPDIARTLACEGNSRGQTISHQAA